MSSKQLLTIAHQVRQAFEQRTPCKLPALSREDLIILLVLIHN
ncbi:hypothetical protein AB6E05_01275 [Vibrio alginolyticus]